MNDDIGRVEDLVQLAPDTARGAFGINRFPGGGCGRVVRVGFGCIDFGSLLCVISQSEDRNEEILEVTDR